MRNTILIVDDEKASLLALKRNINKAFNELDIIIASDGLEAWNLIKDNRPDILLTDVVMPKLDGIRLLEKIRSSEQYNNLYIIIMTGQVDHNRSIEALDKGADDFLSKPVNNDELIARIKSALRFAQLQNRLIDENSLLMQLASELERDIDDMTKLAVKFLQARIPQSYDTLRRVAAASVWIARQLDELDDDEIKDIEIAAFLCQAGKVVLPDELINKPVVYDGQATDKIMYQVPVTARDIVGSVRRFKDVSDMLYSMYENFDGSGFPEKRQSWQIPIGARIIRVALDYEIFRDYSGMTARKSVNAIKTAAKRFYDHRVVLLLEHYVRSILKEDYDPDEMAVRLSKLVPGMLLTRDIITNSGLKLMPSGAVLKERTINQLININTSDPILGNIYVKKRLSSG